ncbi:unnamed protein product [Staurois parvus]|uniref:Uncharacterized protein n=1 Tax=Staurois parvus TaxID=386267 RepID=A0ABN9DJ73_9NEOB|nr:unnamed protein product [Staurois parvus]
MGPPDRSRSTRSSPTAPRRSPRNWLLRRLPSPKKAAKSPRRRRPAKPPPQPRAPRSRPPRDQQRLQPRR